MRLCPCQAQRSGRFRSQKGPPSITVIITGKGSRTPGHILFVDTADDTWAPSPDIDLSCQRLTFIFHSPTLPWDKWLETKKAPLRVGCSWCTHLSLRVHTYMHDSTFPTSTCTKRKFTAVIMIKNQEYLFVLCNHRKFELRSQAE